MSFLAKAFGGSGKKQEEQPSTQEAIQQLRQMEEKLQKKGDFLKKKIDQEVDIVKTNAATNKRAAIMALKRKKRFEKQLKQTDGTLLRIESQRQQLENAITSTEVLNNMNYAAKALKSAQQLSVDDVYDMMEDINEQHEIADEIANAISNAVGFSQDINEGELNGELEELEQEDVNERLLDVAIPSQLSSVPNELPAPGSHELWKYLLPALIAFCIPWISLMLRKTLS